MSENRVSVSVIMAVYNGERYLREALDSIVEQDFSDWELIVVNDGSTDGTEAILSQYAERDCRIKVICQPNQGVAVSRQVGIDLARGKYCIHVDSDDWVEPDYLSLLVSRAEETGADMVWCDIYCDASAYWSYAAEESSDALIRGMLSQKIWGGLWNRLIKTEICRDRGVKFPSECDIWEDLVFVVCCLTFCKCVVYLPKPLYHYRQHQLSATHTMYARSGAKRYTKAVNQIDDFFRKQGISSYDYELTSLKLFAIKDYIDDLRFQDYNRFMNTYPDAIKQMHLYPNYPRRLKLSAWLLQRGLSGLIPVVSKVDAVARRLGWSKQ